MKRLLYISLMLVVFTSCHMNDYDNYSGPNASIYGVIIDDVTNESFQTEQPDGARVVFMEKAYENPEPIKTWVQAEGNYRNDALWNGTYDVYLDEIAGIPSPAQTVEVNGEKELNFTVTPFLSIDTLSINNYGKTISIEYHISKNVNDEEITERAVFLNSIDRVSQKFNEVTVKKSTNAEGDFKDKILAPDFGTYYIRLGALTKNANGNYNYSKVIKVEVTDNGLEDPDGEVVNPGIEEGRIFESFDEESSLDAWETKYNFTTEFLEPGKVKITMGSIDGYGIFAKNNVKYNVDLFPIFAIKVYNTPPDDNWQIKMYDGQVDVVLNANEAMGKKDLPDGSKAYYWDITAVSNWTGEKVSNIQIAVVGSGQPLTFGWIRSFKDENAVGEEDFYKEGRVYELFDEESKLDSWETKYNFTTEFLEAGKVKITMGSIDGYGIFAKNNVKYNLDLFPIFAIKVYNTPPDDNWQIKMYDGQVDVVLNASEATGKKELPDGSKVYCWDMTAKSDWSGEKVSNIQIAVVGSSQPLTFGWLKTFEDENSIR
ncbi:MAG: DUF3823 domain-containing protein [Prolixibacteraceae bacterium]|jgi:hypothetical protein|nr:DUF3823 domain-containing protein [Prolixibacteraceae bacterium]